MDQEFDFRALLIKLQNCLSVDDRRRLHFLMGDMIPRQIRDDPTLGGTLNLLESLFDQGRINSQDFGCLMHAFREIGCHAAVQRLREHQRSQNPLEQTGTLLEQLINDEETVDKIQHTDTRNLLLINESRPGNGTSILFNPLHTRDRSNPSAQVATGEVHTNPPLLIQSIRSRLTICQITLFVMNLIGIISFLIIVMTNKKRNIPSGGIMLTRVGSFHGRIDGGQPFSDAADCSLTFNDRITEIKGQGTKIVLNYITFVYSNKNCTQRGKQANSEMADTEYYKFKLESNEYINGVTVYTGTRWIQVIENTIEILLVIGLRFRTNKGRSSELFGSSNGTAEEESFLDYHLGYAQGRAEGNVDAIQFNWYKEIARTERVV